MARGRTFGLTSNGRGRGRGRGRWRGAASAGGKGPGTGAPSAQRVPGEDGTNVEERFHQVRTRDEIDERLGFWRFQEGEEKEAWLVNMHPTLVKDEEWPSGRSAVDFYFIQDDGATFKSTVLYEPYFYVGCKSGSESVVEEWLMRKFDGLIIQIARDRKEDLKMPNHLLGYRRTYLKLLFRNINDLLSVRKDVLPIELANRTKLDAVDAYADMISATSGTGSGFGAVEVELEEQGGEEQAWSSSATGSWKGKGRGTDPADLIIDVREYDVPYYLRVAIDNDIRVGMWYTVRADAGSISLRPVPERVKRAEPVVMAFDIETTKQPLKFPDSASDQVMMISYMVDGQGFLITNREIVSEDIQDFEYTPKEEYEGPFVVFNEPDEVSVIRRFFEHIREARPTVMATYNGDSFDFPFLEARSTFHGIDMMHEIGFARDSEDEFKSRSCAHMDCFRWVKRDSYLPQGSQGLKAVTVAKLGYDPLELDPELMTPYAVEQPQTLAQYSVSDAVATYYLYMKYVHPFIFSLCNIIPLNPDEVLRKGSGTLCETLLMVQAYVAEIIMPNRHVDPTGAMFEGHLLESETYVGGHVEALEAGVFRSDIPTDFKVEPQACQQLIDELDAALQFAIVEEGKMALGDVANYDEVKAQIRSALETMRDQPLRQDKPLIYHLDVAAMYPNIMLSNRLQPDSVVDDATCATCDYNRPGKTCDRRMTWAWRGEYFPAKRDEFNMIQHALNQESFPPKQLDGPKRQFTDLTPSEQTSLLHKRLGDYSRKVYKKTHETKIVYKEATICQRENPFYIDTVRAFRDRRYEYKGLHKTWKKNLDKAVEGDSLTEIVEAKKMIVLYDSLQLAHKCILNSFYGYVMRKGARWYSMEMAGITCLTGATIIQMARQLVEQIGRPLELDTDGIWCMLPGVFPEDFTFKFLNGKSLKISYPCTMLNHLVHARFTNHQYHDLVDKDAGVYGVHSENSIFFELDGPYRAMILPSSKEEDKLLKKRYAVFNHDGSLAELKGFEVKRRGELQLIKIFQGQIFEKFLLGETLDECYAAVAKVADQWLDVLFSKGASLDDGELVDLIAENRSMSKTLAEYGGQKSTSISTARRLAEFLGEQMVKDKGLSCRFIISSKPQGAPVTERAVPVTIFSAEPSVKRHFLRKWLKDNSLSDFDLRSVLDWGYYVERLGSVIQKLITIPAAMQKVTNPVPRIRHPDWLFKRVTARTDKFKQHKLTDMFAKQAVMAKPALAKAEVPDIESFGEPSQPRLDALNGKAASLSSARRSKAAVAGAIDLEESAPDMREDYSGWLRVMRKRWRRQREERRERQRANGHAMLPGPARGALGSLFQQRSMTLASSVWDVVQIVPTARPGEFKLWLSINHQLQAVKLRIPREFYLNLKSLPRERTFLPSYRAEQLVRTLPRGHPALNLFKISVPENVFLQEESHFSSLLNHPNVDGVYETQVPLEMRALLKLGAFCAMDKAGMGRLSKGLDTGFDLEDLVKAAPSLARHKYLGDGRGRELRYLYLYHAAKDGRHIFGLFTPDAAVAKVYVVESAGLRQLPNLEKAYADRVAAARDKGGLKDGAGVFDYSNRIKFDTNFYRQESLAFRALSKELVAQRSGRSTMLVVCSARELSYYERHVPSVSEFPVLMVDGMSREDNFPPLGWQLFSSKRMLGHYLHISSWVTQRIALSAHFDVPLCNVGKDIPIFLADIEFARRLIRQDMVLWWAPGLAPDLGGREEDAHAQQADDLASPEFSKPGCYSNVCLEIELRDLAVNAVLQSALVNEMEGSGAGAMAFDASSHTLDEYSKGTAHSALALGDAVLSQQTFLALKSMVKSWYLEKARGGSELSDLLVAHFWRWVSSNLSALFDPALHRFIHGLMKKTFLQLLAEFKRLGSSVVYASFGRIFLLTTKPTAGSAYAYGNYILSAVCSRQLFKHVSLDMVHFWDTLLWMDNANFGGVIDHNPAAVEPTMAFQVEMAWNVQSFLPLALQPHFEHVIGQFIYKVCHCKRQSAAQLRTPLKVLQNMTQTQANPVKTKEVQRVKKYVNEQLFRHLLKVVDNAVHEMSHAAVDPDLQMQYAFPILPGTHLNPTNPVLEFIKTTVAVLGLAQELSVEVQVIRRNLLHYIGVRDFADEAMWRDPCENPFKLPLVICTYCNDMRDFDLCRDADLLPLPAVDALGKPLPGGTSTARVWQCASCKTPYDRRGIESKLVDVVRRHVTAYQLQDLQCTKCRQIKADYLSSHCECSGVWGCKTTRAEMVRKLRSLGNIAKYHDLGVLAEVLEWHLANL